MGRNNADFDSVSFSGHITEEGSHILASHQGNTVGYLAWGHDGEVNHVFVDPSARHQGIATQMWSKAHEHAATMGVRHPKHSEDQTEAGKAWAAKTPTPKGYTEDEVEEMHEDAWYQAEIKRRQQLGGKDRAAQKSLNSIGRAYDHTAPKYQREDHLYVLEMGAVTKRETKRMNQSRKVIGRPLLPTYTPKKKS